MALVTYDEQILFLGLEDGTDEDLIEALLVETQALFETQTGRSLEPFGVAQTGRTEIHEGDAGSTILSLDYPISSITSIVVGRDVAFPDETITPSDTSMVVWQAGTRDLIRVDGGYWNRWYPSWVKVVYNTQADAPLDVKLAIKQKVAEIYMHKDKIGFSSITRGARSWSIAEGTGANPASAWDQTVRAYRRAWVR